MWCSLHAYRVGLSSTQLSLFPSHKLQHYLNILPVRNYLWYTSNIYFFKYNSRSMATCFYHIVVLQAFVNRIYQLLCYRMDLHHLGQLRSAPVAYSCIVSPTNTAFFRLQPSGVTNALNA